ncbi:MAG: carboxypeptidase regulatory-like domain-containing protein [Acidobacteriota bacterium]
MRIASKSPWVGLTLVLSLLLLNGEVAAQVSGGNILGRIKDASGGVIPGVEIQVENRATGATRSTVTGDDGTFLVPNLNPGPYRITAHISGFQTQAQEIDLLIGQSADLNFTLRPAGVAQTVTVRALPPMVETDTATLHDSLTPTQVKNLPINGRDFTTLATLVPGVTTGNVAVNQNYDPVKRRIAAISVNGQSGRNLNMLIDGADNTDIFMGGQNIQLSLEAVQEFDVITHDPKAQYGRGIGGTVNVVTKSGGNDFHGSAFAFFRDDSLRSNDAISEGLGSEEPPFDSQQFGATIGGPIKRDRWFFFYSYERQQEDTSRVFNSGGAFPSLDGTATGQNFRQNLHLGRVDGKLNDDHSFFARFAEQDNDTPDIFFSPNDAPDSSANESNNFYDVTTGLTSVFGSTKINSFRFHFQRFENALRNNVSSLDVPTLIFPAASFGASQAGTQAPFETTYQVRDDFSWISGRHQIRFGSSIIIQPDIGIRGDFRHNRFLFANNDFDPATFTIGPTNEVLNFRSWSSPTFDIKNRTMRHYGFYIQDDIRLGRLTLVGGLRYDVVQNFFYNRGTVAEAVVRDNVGKVDIPGFPKRREPETDKDNFAPRVAAAFDLTGTGNAVVRAGYSRIFDPASILASTLFADLEVTQQNGDPPLDFIFVPGAFLGFFGIVPGQVIDLTGLSDTFPQGFVNSPDLEMAHSDQISAGVSYNFREGPAAGLTLDFDFAYARTRQLTQGRNLNYCLDPTDCNPGTDPSKLSFPEAGTIGFGFPRQVYLLDSTGRNDYKAFIVSARRRFADRWQLFTSYTLSKAETDTNQFTFVVLDQARPNAPDEFGPTEFDERHRFVFSGMVLLPGDVQLSTIFTAASARAFTAGSNADVNGDGVPSLFGAINNGQGGSRTFGFDGDRTEPRGSRRGDPTYNFDLRVSKLFPFSSASDEFRFEAFIEVFNLFNTTNFGNNIFSNLDDPERFGTPINIITPPRTAQIGLRLTF